MPKYSEQELDKALDDALLGDLDAELKIAHAYYEGWGVEKNLGLAWVWAKQTSDKGSHWGDFVLGSMYLYGDGVDINYKESARLFKQAEHKLPEACEMLGQLYMVGAGVRKNKKIAFQYFSKAVAGSVSYAYFCLGYCYQNGEGVEKDTSKAIQFYEIAARKNITQAMVELGRMYLSGEGVRKDTKKAIEYLKAGVEKGDIESKVRLAFIYFEDDGAYKNQHMAFKLATDLALKNNYFGQVLLGTMYQEGLGVEVDYESAKYWIEKSEKNSLKSQEVQFGQKKFSCYTRTKGRIN